MACPRVHDAIVIGGGYFGIRVAEYLVTRGGLHDVVLIEAEAELMSRASLRNQGRVHGGYHYTRSWTTAMGSRINLPRFVDEYRECLREPVTSIYAVSRRNSKINGAQFQRFCQRIGAPAAPAPESVVRLFEPQMVDGVFVVEEPVLDVDRFAEVCRDIIAKLGIAVYLRTRVVDLRENASGWVELSTEGALESRSFAARRVYQCTYSGLGALRQGRSPGRFLKHELAELAVVHAPAELQGMAITVVDGSFFSLLPHGSGDEHSLSHVRYTPGKAWGHQPNVDPYAQLVAAEPASRFDHMVRAGSRYLPALSRCNYLRSIFEIKTVLAGNESDDGRPILYLPDTPVRGCTSILGGKLDNVYDVLARLAEHSATSLDPPTSASEAVGPAGVAEREGEPE